MPTPKSASTAAATTNSSLTPNQISLMEDAAKGPVELTNSKLSRTAKSLAKRGLGVVDSSVTPPVFNVADVAPGKTSKSSTKKQPHPSVAGGKPKTSNPKTSNKSAATKPKKERKPKAEKPANGLNKTQDRILTALKSTSKGNGLNRSQLIEATGIQKGWSRVLGAVAGGKSPKEESMIGMGLVKAEKLEGQSLTYYITSKGSGLLS